MTDARSLSRRERRKELDGQAMVETVVSLVGSLVLLFGMIVIWGWVNQSLVGRQVGDAGSVLSYQQTRAEAGQPTTAGVLNPYQQLRLSVFGERSGDRLTVGGSTEAVGARVRRKAGAL